MDTVLARIDEETEDECSIIFWYAITYILNMIKNENIGIALGAIVEQVIKICNDEQKANQQLYQM